MPDSLATRCGAIDISQNAWMIAAVIESWPQPAQSVVIAPFVVAARQADLVLLQRGVIDLGFGDVCHLSIRNTVSSQFPVTSSKGPSNGRGGRRGTETPFELETGNWKLIRLQRYAALSSFAFTPLITWCALIGKPP